MPSTSNVLDEARDLVKKRLAELDEERKRLERALAELGGKATRPSRSPARRVAVRRPHQLKQPRPPAHRANAVAAAAAPAPTRR